jgi:DNA transposition AAA+ family ATPase
MKTMQLVETENVKNANRVLKNLLERPKTEVVGLGLFYGSAGRGKTRWCIKTAQEKGYIYLRLETNITLKDFLKELLFRLSNRRIPYNEIKGSVNMIYSRVLEVLQNDSNSVIFIDEVDIAFQNVRILSTIRDLVDGSLATIVLIGMEKAKEMLIQMNRHYFDRCFSIYEFKQLNRGCTEMLVNSVCDVQVDSETIDYIHSKCNGTARIINKYIDGIERIARRMKKDSLSFNEIKEILTRVET